MLKLCWPPCKQVEVAQAESKLNLRPNVREAKAMLDVAERNLRQLNIALNAREV